MIVQDTSDGTLRLITQQEHAKSAAALARWWKPPESLGDANWARFLLAVEHHDDGWEVAERQPTLDEAGRPMDFRGLPTPEHAAIWRRGIDAAMRLDPYVGLLVAQHARWLYTEQVSHDDDGLAAQSLINQLTTQIDRALDPLRLGDTDEKLAVHPKNLMLARRLLSWFDGLSLMLLGAIEPPADGKTEPLGFGDTVTPMKVRCGVGVCAVDPWPFAQPGPIELTTRAIRMGPAPYASSAALDEAMRSATMQELTLRVEPLEPR